ncbi:F0F1 ATP synthase subunit A [Clostridium aminobutyricum]|uniref:ATP synthase subunit a n=1 Tax=Clostridium aminobutyricum TaxID=33953 RepID=A0A939D9A0_CLOAM|nr:F0F1 ATP synthase subunit A [Clostridium aminobutyricum]MBN7773073.1 F0F1 ATP synthase subunit A [Clostridium aminobutyricum]
MHMNPETVFSFNIFNHSIAVTTSIVTQWIIMAVIIVLVLLLTRNLGKVPNKKQNVLEMFVNMINGLVKSNMGDEYKRFFVPYIGAMAVFMGLLNLSGLVGIEPATKDINVAATFALMTFVLINANAISKCGVGGYAGSFFKPYAAMLPLNLLEKLTIPLSLSLRLFCNMLVGTIVLGIVYEAMGKFAFIAPIPLHAFFDIFDGLIQVFVFMMLTMVYIKIGADHGAEHH